MEARAVHGNYCHDETEHVLMAVGQVGVNSIVALGGSFPSYHVPLNTSAGMLPSVYVLGVPLSGRYLTGLQVAVRSEFYTPDLN